MFKDTRDWFSETLAQSIKMIEENNKSNQKVLFDYVGEKRSLYASKGDIMAWKNKFEKWISVADEIEHNNGRGSEEDLYEHFTKEIVEHVMYTRGKIPC